MYRCLLALALLSPSATAVARAIQWQGAGWYVLMFGFTDWDDAEPGWLEVSAGSYSDETGCNVEADRRNAVETEYMLMFMCRYLDRPPKPDGAGGIMIYIPDPR